MRVGAINMGIGSVCRDHRWFSHKRLTLHHRHQTAGFAVGPEHGARAMAYNTQLSYFSELLVMHGISSTKKCHLPRTLAAQFMDRMG